MVIIICTLLTSNLSDQMAEGVNASIATQNVVDVVDELLEIECTEDNHELAGCRICDRGNHEGLLCIPLIHHTNTITI